MMILGQAMVAYAYGLVLAEEATDHLRRRAVRKEQPTDGSRHGNGMGKKAFHRQLRLLARFQKTFLRNTSALRNCGPTRR